MRVHERLRQGRLDRVAQMQALREIEPRPRAPRPVRDLLRREWPQILLGVVLMTALLYLIASAPGWLK